MATLHNLSLLHHAKKSFRAGVTGILSFNFNKLNKFVTPITPVTPDLTGACPAPPCEVGSISEGIRHGPGSLRTSAAYGAGNPRISIS